MIMANDRQLYKHRKRYHYSLRQNSSVRNPEIVNFLSYVLCANMAT